MITNHFTPRTASLGLVKLGTKTTARYTRASGPGIANIQASCGCTTPIWDNNTIEITYTAPATLPEWPRAEGLSQFTDEKYITVRYDDGSLEMLEFVATVTE